MAIVLNMTPEQEAQLAQEAQVHGQGVEDYVTAKLLGQLGPAEPINAQFDNAGETLDEWQKAIDENLVWLTSAPSEISPGQSSGTIGSTATGDPVAAFEERIRFLGADESSAIPLEALSREQVYSRDNGQK